MGSPTSRPVPDFLSVALPETGEPEVNTGVKAGPVIVVGAGVGAAKAARGYRPAASPPASARGAAPNPTALELADALRGVLEPPHGQ